MKLSLTAFLKGLALCGCMLLYFPVLALLLCLLRPDSSVWLCLLLQLAVLLAGWCGFGVSFLLNRTGWPGVWKNVTAILAGVLAAALCGGIFAFAGVWPAILAAAFCMAGCAWAERLYYRSYDDLLGIVLILAAAAVNLLVLIALWAMTDAYAQFSGGISFCYLLTVLIYALVRNQSNIDQLMERRRHKLEHLPKRIRYYNALLLGILCLVILLLFLFRQPLAKGIAWAGRELLRLVFLLIGGILGAIGRLFPSSEEEYSAPSSQLPFLPGTEEGEAASFPAEIVLLLILLLLLFLLRKRILAGLKWLAGKLSGLLHKSRLLQQDHIQSEYYEDHVQSLSEAERAGQEKPETWAELLRQWKRLYRKYWRLSDPGERFSAGYGLLLGWLRLNEVAVSPSDTTLDILQKGEAQFTSFGGSAATEAYNLFLYREDTPDAGQLEQLDAFVRHLPELK